MDAARPIVSVRLRVRPARRGRGPRHADDGAIYRDQGRQSGLPAVLPDGRFLRAVLRGRRSRRRARSASCSPSAASISARDIPMCGVPVHRADEYLHRLIALGHRVAVCEQTRGPGRGEQARRQERGAPRRHPPRHARHAHRGHAARRAAQQLSARHRARARVRRRAKAASRSPGSTSRPANSASPNATAPGLPAEIARLEPGEIIVSDALYGDAGARAAICARCRR